MPDSASPKPMLAETALVVVDKAERKALRRKKRDEWLALKVQRVTASSLADVDLKRHAFKTDDELVAAGLDKQQIQKVRQWELPKKAIAYALEASNQHVTAMLRAKQEQASVRINVENMQVVQLPPKQAETATPVVIEVDVEDRK
ncbi:MAG: hypothetical protein EHM35_01400 [Planctomycetaceae bacterium]|nr:MAG: hypothetical protein EHM35_01400 [Planctomycetaceae bacterium]